jgi:hypothetical protein
LAAPTTEVALGIGGINDRPERFESWEAFGSHREREYRVTSPRVFGFAIIWNHQHARILPDEELTTEIGIDRQGVVPNSGLVPRADRP